MEIVLDGKFLINWYGDKVGIESLFASIRISEFIEFPQCKLRTIR